MRFMRELDQTEAFLRANFVKGRIGLLSVTDMISPRIEDDQADARRPIVQSLKR